MGGVVGVSFETCIEREREVTDKAADAWSQFDGDPNMKLFQIQMDHTARPSALYDLRGTARPFTSLPSSM